MKRTFNLKGIVSKSAFVLFVLMISIFMISCDTDQKKVEGEPSKLVDMDKVEDQDNEVKEDPEEVEVELVEYIVENPLITYTKEDGLYYAYILEGQNEEVSLMHQGHVDDFNNPRISPDGNFIVYTFQDDLYGYNLEVKDYGLIVENVVSYAYFDEQTLIYSAENKGLTKFDLISGDTLHEPDDNIYENLTYAKDNILYGKRILEWSDDKGQYATNVGIVQIDANNLETELIIEGIRDSEDDLGYDPTIFNISKDGRYIYLMEKFQSGSMSADFGSLGIYDTETKTHTAFEDIYEDKDWIDDDLIVLPRQNNLAINPQKGNIISVIKGGGREMLREKEVVILDIVEDKSFELVRFMDENLVAKTPTFSLDGKKLYFSATEGMEPGVGNDNEFENWFAQYHNIYEYDLESAEVRKLTEETSFDIIPISLGDTVLYFRSQDNELDKFSLLKLNNELNGIDDMLLEDIVFKDKFYGNIHPATSMDILLHSKKF